MKEVNRILTSRLSELTVQKQEEEESIKAIMTNLKDKENSLKDINKQIEELEKAINLLET